MKHKNSNSHHSHKTASFYGFLPATGNIKDFVVTKGDQKKVRGRSAATEEKVALTRMFIERKMSSLPQPVMIFYKGPMVREDSCSSHGDHTFHIDIIGNSKSIADAMMIETSYVIAKEEYPDFHVEVELNSIGDRDSLRRLERELKSFYKKNWSKVPQTLKALYKKDIFESFRSDDKKAVELRELGPMPIGCLSEHSRDHFREVLEYIEMLGLPYSVNPSLLGDTSYGSETVFEVVATSERHPKKTVARGQRYNGVARKFLNKKDVASIGSSIVLKKNLARAGDALKNVGHKLFFIQLGYDAKLKSLQVLEMLRKAKISVYQSLSKDKMGAQIAMAEKMNIPYIAIMGKKEAVEDSVLVRNMTTRCQDTVPLSELADYAKKLK